MPSSAIKYHIFKEKSFQGLVYCDYCGKLLWGLGRQGVQCTECGYNSHTTCSDMVIQCRPSRHYSPDSLSITDSEAESLSKYSTNRHSTTMEDTKSTTSSHRKNSLSRMEMPPINRKIEEPLKSPTLFSGTTHGSNETYLRSKHSLNKSYRKSLKHQLQSLQLDNTETMSPHATAKAFTRLVARSKAFFFLGQSIYTIYCWKNKMYSCLACLCWIACCKYIPPFHNMFCVVFIVLLGLSRHTVLFMPPLLILFLYFKIGIQPHQNASQILLPRFDENTPEYYTNLENMQYAFLFLIRLYDNLVYHVQHITLTTTTYGILFFVSLFVSWMVLMMGQWLVMVMGLVVLLNKTWVGGLLEILLQFCMEVVQTMVDLGQKCMTSPSVEKKPIEISVYENQRWWAGTGYTSQLLKSERASWSNITGLEPLPSKDDMPSPAHYVWAEDSEWKLDTTGPWTDDALDLVQWIECDEQGWVYSDHRWSNPRGHPDLVSHKSNDTKALTRRRRWFRRANPLTHVDIGRMLHGKRAN